MLKIMKERWAENESKLRDILANKTDLYHANYEDLTKLTFETIFNREGAACFKNLDLERMTVIDDGDYQGTIVFMIPFNTYQPSEYEYIMTYIGYGSCSYCDALQHVTVYIDDNEKPEEQCVIDLMSICKDLICNAIKPYNYGWRYDENFDVVKEENNNDN